jgi:Ca2+-binding RTX toxin-like protein
MSYTEHPSSNLNPQTLMLYDVLALQYLYGANTTYNTGNTVISYDPDQVYNEVIWDAGGVDTLAITGNSTRAVTININEGAFSSVGIENNGAASVDNIAVAFNAQIENISAGAGNDTLTGNNLGNTILGGGGLDTIFGGSGNDVMEGGDGADNLNGGVGIDAASYENSTTAVGARLDGLANWAGAAGDSYTDVESLIGSAQGDWLVGGASANTLSGGNGNDTIWGAAGVDSILGGLGDDLIYGGADADSIDGGGGTDTVTYADSTTSIGLRIGPAANWAGAAGDTYSNVERFIGSIYNDIMVGDNDNNTLDGEAGADRIWGSFGDDTLLGNAGDDTLIGGSGSDLHDGGAGSDTVDYASSGFAVGVRLDGGASWAGAIGDTFASIEKVIGSGFNDVLIGSAGGDTLDGAAGDDTYWADGGNDTILASDGADAMNGGAGIDTVDYSASSGAVGARLDNAGSWLGAAGDTFGTVENLIGSAFGDVLVGDDGANTLNGGLGDDTLWGGNGNDVLIGAAGADVLNGGNGSDTASYATASVGLGARLDGRASWGDAAGDSFNSIESLVGSAYNDILVGNTSNNVLNGGRGNDILYTSTGADVIIFTVGFGTDTAADFADNVDTLYLDDALWTGTLTTAQVVSNFGSDAGGSGRLDFGNGDAVIVSNLAVASLIDDIVIF